MTRWLLAALSLAALLLSASLATPKETESPLSSGTFSGLTLRSIGPALTSGRVTDLAVNPASPHEYYVAAASGGVWKTIDNGATWEPIFDGESSYSVGCVTLDPHNSLVVWVGTGENNSQRSVAYGDGVYKSLDGGRNWQNVGLKESEHIAKIVIDPRDSDHVYVAAQGPLWKAGGDRGLYETKDGGTTWRRCLEIDADTGVTDVVMDPRDPDVLYAASYQRRRHVWTLIDGGPGSGIHKSIDGGATWTKLDEGLPKKDMGRIGLALSANPDVVYAIIEATGDEEGFYRSTDQGHNWKKMSDYVSGSPQYYQELFADHVNPDRVYAVDTFLHVTENGGESFEMVPETHKHVDNHVVWIDPDDTDHLRAGCDGGVYESYDRGQHWEFKANLPIVQFYKISADQDLPFYNVYGGTQDNNTLGGPSRTVSGNGIANRDWFVTLGGDGFEPQVDPTNPDIIYSQYQNGGLGRFDRRTGEIIDIQPQPSPAMGALKWNWSSAFLISPHSPTRLYYGANILFRSDDRGDTWVPVSGDLTRQLDRNQLEVMGRVWSVDAVAKNRSTSFYGNIVSLSESPLHEGLLYAGTDDGLVQVTTNGGESWTRVASFKGVPDMSYISGLTASSHDVNVVYATVDNHKRGDFKPYVLRSNDQGKSFRSIAGDLPERGHAHVIVEDHVNSDLLFVGTEFGVYFTIDGGKKWIQLKGDLPTIACRDLEIQRRENDLVVGTFGRGIYILDDYTPLRHVSEAALNEPSLLFPVKNALMYVESLPLSLPGKSMMGDDYFLVDNPDPGAVITYYLKDSLQTREEKRQETESAAREKGDPNPYPAWEELRREDREEDPQLILTIRDDQGEVVRRLTGPIEAGLHRVTWDMRYPAPDPTSLSSGGWRSPWDPLPIGPMVVPGTYSVSLSQRVDGVLTELQPSQSFATVPLGLATLPTEDWGNLVEFMRDTADLQRAVLGSIALADEAQSRIDHLKQSMFDAATDNASLETDLRTVETKLKDLRITLEGDRTIRRRSEPTVPSISDRLSQIVYGHWMTSTAAPTKTYRDNYDIAADQFGPVLHDLRQIVQEDLPRIEQAVEESGAPWTPGRIPVWPRR